MRKLSMWAYAVILAGVLACGDGVPEVDGEPVAGMHDGAEWTFVEGNAFDGTVDGAEVFEFWLYDQQIEPCGEGPELGRRLEFSAPTEVGDYFRAAAFVAVEENATRRRETGGDVSIDEIGDEVIRGEVTISRNDEFEVRGSFAAHRCD